MDNVALDEYFLSIDSYLSAGKKLTFQHMVDAPFGDKLHSTNLDLGIVVLLKVEKTTQIIDRLAFSNTEAGNNAAVDSIASFYDIKIPMDATQNSSVKALRSGKPHHTQDWYHLFTPVLNADDARLKQSEAGMDCSYIYPFKWGSTVGGLIFSFYQPLNNITKYHKTFMQRYTDKIEGLIT